MSLSRPLSRPLVTFLLVGAVVVAAGTLQTLAQQRDAPAFDPPAPATPPEPSRAPDSASQPFRLLPPVNATPSLPKAIRQNVDHQPAVPSLSEELSPAEFAAPPAPRESEGQAEVSPAIQATINELLNLRRQLGSPMAGTVLDDEQNGDDFADLLQEAMTRPQQPPTPLDIAPPPQPLPPRPGVADSLRDSAAALDQHANRLDELRLSARADRMRQLARRLRREAQEIQELAIE